MSEDAATGVCTGTCDEGTASTSSGILRIGVTSLSNRKDDKTVKLSINIPNCKKHFSVELPLRKILEDEDDDDDGGRILKVDNFTEVCPRCSQVSLSKLVEEDSTKRITKEITTSLKQLLLSKLLERLAKRILFKNYEKLLAFETSSCDSLESFSGVFRALPCTSEIHEKHDVSPQLQEDLPSSDGVPQDAGLLNMTTETASSGSDERVLCAPHGPINSLCHNSTQSALDSMTNHKEKKETHCAEELKIETRTTSGEKTLNSRAGTAGGETEKSLDIHTREDEKHIGANVLKQFADVGTETFRAPERLDKSTTIHLDQSTQTGDYFDNSGSTSALMRDFHDSRMFLKQTSSVSSSCQTDVEENTAFDFPSGRPGLFEERIHQTPRSSVVIPRKSPSIATKSDYGSVNGEHDELERNNFPLPESSKSLRKYSNASHAQDDSATETESISSSFVSSASSSAFQSKANGQNLKSVMQFGKEVAEVCNERFKTSQPKATEIKKIQNQPHNVNKVENNSKETEKTVVAKQSSRIEGAAAKFKDPRQSLTDGYLKNIGPKYTPNSRRPSTDQPTDIHIPDPTASKDFSAPPSTNSSQPSASSLTVKPADSDQSKPAPRGRSFSIKSTGEEPKRMFDFGLSYAKKLPNGPQENSQSSAASAPTQESKTQSEQQSVNPASRTSQIKPASSGESKTQPLKSGSRTGSEITNKVTIGAESDAASVCSNISSSASSLKLTKPVEPVGSQVPKEPSSKKPTPNTTTSAPATKKPQSSFKNLLSAFETKAQDKAPVGTKKFMFK